MCWGSLQKFIFVLEFYSISTFELKSSGKTLRQKDRKEQIKKKKKKGVILHPLYNWRLRAAALFPGGSTVFSPRCSLTNSLAYSGGWIHLVAVVAFALVPSLQVDADLTADAWVQTLIDVCTQREEGGEEEKTEGIQLVSDMFN